MIILMCSEASCQSTVEEQDNKDMTNERQGGQRNLEKEHLFSQEQQRRQELG